MHCGVFVGPQSADTCQCIACSLQHPRLNDRSYYDACHQRVCHRYVTVRP